jgi:hypothetical protein
VGGRSYAVPKWKSSMEYIFTRPVCMIGRWIWSSFFEMLYSLRVRQGGEDRICWIPSKRRKFEVRSYYHVLSIPASSPFPWKSIWRVKAPLRVAFFVWTTTLGKILTLDNLRKRNVIVVDWCCMCKKSESPLITFFFTVK